MPPRAVLFDFDGVIADTENHHIAAWQRTSPAWAGRSPTRSLPGPPRSTTAVLRDLFARARGSRTATSRAGSAASRT